jgi:sulfide dehydrogenase cytochrome subunit
MKKTNTYTLILAGSLMFNTTGATENGDLLLLVGNCEGCHGPNGASLGPAVPTIAGMKVKTFIEAMEEYQQEKRPSTIMDRIAKGYNSTDFQKMAKYFAQKTFVRYPQTVDPQKVARGSELHYNYCEKCHEDGGYTDEEGSGILAGQWMPYLQFSLVDFHTGVRDMPRKMKKRLQKMVKRHGERSLDDIVHFYGSQNKIKMPHFERHHDEEHED